MFTPVQARGTFETEVKNLMNHICTLIDIRLADDILKLEEGKKVAMPLDVVARQAFINDRIRRTQFEKKREVIIEAIRECYETRGWTVLYGTTGKCSITNKNLDLVFSIREEKND